jgi:D-sedoheptulose 7-phosphate isomerase
VSLLISSELRRSAGVIERIDPAQIRAAADAIKKAVSGGGQVVFMGNGGSSADAQHIAAEFSGKYAFDRPPMAGVSLSNIAPVTAIGNDYSYDLVFKRQVEALCRKGDAVVGFSTSGNSRNVLLALEAAKAIGAFAISFTGDCGRIREVADLPVIIPSTETPRIQEGYLAACHAVCGIVERELFGRKAVLIDRDGTLMRDVPHSADPDRVELLPGAAEAVARLNAAGYLVIVVTNQAGIAMGNYGEAELAEVHRVLREKIAAGGGRIDDIFFCPHDAPERRRDGGRCECRKPGIGMGEAAIMKHNIDPSRSFMVGDSEEMDMRFGEALGMRSILVSPERTLADAADEILAAAR